MIDYTKKASKGIFIMGVGTALSYILAYLFRFLLARNLTVSDYGLFYSCIAFLMLFSVFKDFGIGYAFINQFPKFSKKKIIMKSMFFQTFFFRLSSTILISVILFFLTNFFSS